MKNILSRFGTKKVAGVVLAGATLLVGLGVVSNFSGSQKAANEAALSRFGDSAYNNFAGGSQTSRADLERQMSARQDGYSARFLKGKSDGTEQGEAYGSDGAYAEGVRADEGFVYGSDGAYGPGAGVDGARGTYANGDAYDPFNSTYEQGASGFEEGALGGGVSEAQFQAAQDAAANAAAGGAKGKGGKGGDEGTNSAGARGRLRPATQINKLASSSGGSSFGAGAGGGARGGGAASFGGGSPMGGGDNNTRALPKTGAGDVNSQAFKLGRGGGMGGFNVGFNGSAAKSGNTKSRGAAADLQLAVAYSSKGRASTTETGAKSLEEAAFDGSNPEDLVSTIESGASIGKVASNLLDGNSLGGIPDALKDTMTDIDNTLQETAKQQGELTELQKQINNKIGWLIGVTLVAAIALYFLVKAAYAAPAAWWLWVAAGVLSLAALAFIAIMLWAGDDSIVNLVKEMGNEEKFGLVNQGIDVDEKLTTVGLIAGGLAVVLGLCWLPWSSISSWLSGLGGGAGGGGVVAGEVGVDAVEEVVVIGGGAMA